MSKFDAFADRVSEHAWALTRVVAGLLWAGHGAQKLFGWFGAKATPPLLSQMGVGAVIELVAGVLLALGLFTRPAAFIASGQMAVAFFQFKWKLGDASLNPLLNGGELTAIYSLLWLLYFVRGGGAFSLDGVYFSRAQARN